MKKLLLCLILLLTLTACSNEKKDDSTVHIITTNHPTYDWLMNLCANTDIKVTNLLPKGSDIHSYQPSVQDMIEIKNCDVIIYTGGESDSMIEDTLKDTKDVKAIQLMDVLGNRIKEEEVIEGMTHSHEDHEHEHVGEHELDEHIWLSIENAKVCVQSIYDTIKVYDNHDIILNNYNSYMQELENLSQSYNEVMNKRTIDTIVFGDRFPFLYLVDDYQLNYYAAFSGCSAETEASFDTIIYLANKLDELKLKHIFMLDHSSDKICKTIIDNTTSKDQTILVLDSMQTLSDSSYIDVMKANLEVLKIALKG